MEILEQNTVSQLNDSCAQMISAQENLKTDSFTYVFDPNQGYLGVVFFLEENETRFVSRYFWC